MLLIARMIRGPRLPTQIMPYQNGNPHFNDPWWFLQWSCHEPGSYDPSRFGNVCQKDPEFILKLFPSSNNQRQKNIYTLEDERQEPTAITHLETKMIWTEPPWGHVPAVNLPGCTRSHWEYWKPWLIVWYRGWILPNHMGIIISQYKDPYKPIRIQWNLTCGFCYSLLIYQHPKEPGKFFFRDCLCTLIGR